MKKILYLLFCLSIFVYSCDSGNDSSPIGEVETPGDNGNGDSGGDTGNSDQENYLSPEVDSEGKIIVKYTPKEYVEQVEEGQHMISVRIPKNYYSSAVSLSGSELRDEIQEIISTEASKLSYSTVWTMCENGDQNPENSSQVWQIYKETGIAKTAHVSGSTGWNREHVWAKSHGDFGTSNGPGTDGHHLRASDARENGNRAALDFAFVNGPRTKNSTFYEPPKSAKGDVARAIFYMAVRYGFTVDDLGGQGKAARHGKLEDLLKWNELDPVDPYEIRRNNVIYDFQHNRNPFIDHPELVKYIFGAKKSEVWKN
jgi:endonuclease I